MPARMSALELMERDRQHAEAYRLEHGYADGSIADASRESVAAIAAAKELR